MSRTTAIDISIDLDSICKNYLIGKIATLKMKKGLNIWFLGWDTSDDLSAFEIIRTLTGELLKNIKELEMKDLKYSNIINNQIQVEYNEKNININFESTTMVSDDLMNKISSGSNKLLETTKLYSLCSKVESMPFQLPLYVLLVDTENPQYGELCNVKDINTILNIIVEVLTNKIK